MRSDRHWRRAIRALAPVFVAAFLGCGQDNEPPTAPASEPALSPATSSPLVFRQVSSGDSHNCGVTTNDRAYCWGYGAHGQMGNGTTNFEQLTPGPVGGGLQFRQVSAGQYHGCGVTTENRAYCWGYNGDGALGDGTTTNRLRPVAVAGGLRFRQVSAGINHSCGVTTDDRAYCWGWNSVGQLGNGSHSSSEHRLVPVALVGTLRFRGVTTAYHHSCGVTTTDRAYCWGGDQWGQIGDGSGSNTCGSPGWPIACRPRPTLVAGGYGFRQMDAGGGGGRGEDVGGPANGGRTCGVTTDERAFCWGDGTQGQNGDGTRSMRSSPSAVAGGLHFRGVSAGIWHTCGVTADKRAYCWGWNRSGQVGDGSEGTIRLRPRAVVGGHLFDQVSAGGSGTCGKTPVGAAYCWGYYVGDGTSSSHLRPRAVAGPN